MPSIDQFLDLLQTYNISIWPMQIITSALGLVAVILVFFSWQRSNQAILVILSLFWLWTGLVFCIGYWASLSKPAYLFGALFVIQGVIFLMMLAQGRLSFRFLPGGYSLIGLVVIAYAILGYPMVGQALNHIYPRSLPFGVVPCPTTIFTIGMLMLTDKPFPRYVLVIPLIWSFCGVVPVSKGVLEDIGLICSGLCAFAFLVQRGRTKQPAASATAN